MIVVDVDKVFKGPWGVTGNVVFRDSDNLMAPKKTQEITTKSELQNCTSHIFEPGISRNDYIAKSGGVTQKSDRKRLYFVRASGEVVTGGAPSDGSGARSPWTCKWAIPSSCRLNAERIRALPLWQAVTTNVYNLAVSLVAIQLF